MVIGIHGQWIYPDVDRCIAIVKQSSQPVSKDEVLNGSRIWITTNIAGRYFF
jgi:hypothetical protein